MKENESQHLQVDSQSENSFENKNFAFFLNFWNEVSN
jgi:NADPH-dependent 7-cyano-7-deazaguanine reductase QueF-like protein